MSIEHQRGPPLVGRQRQMTVSRLLPTPAVGQPPHPLAAPAIVLRPVTLEARTAGAHRPNRMIDSADAWAAASAFGRSPTPDGSEGPHHVLSGLDQGDFGTLSSDTRARRSSASSP